MPVTLSLLGVVLAVPSRVFDLGTQRSAVRLTSVLDCEWKRTGRRKQREGLVGKLWARWPLAWEPCRAGQGLVWRLGQPLSHSVDGWAPACVEVLFLGGLTFPNLNWSCVPLR